MVRMWIKNKCRIVLGFLGKKLFHKLFIPSFILLEISLPKYSRSITFVLLMYHHEARQVSGPEWPGCGGPKVSWYGARGAAPPSCLTVVALVHCVASFLPQASRSGSPIHGKKIKHLLKISPSTCFGAQMVISPGKSENRRWNWGENSSVLRAINFQLFFFICFQVQF